MFDIDSRTRARIEPVIRRILVVDPNTVSARLIVDIMKGLGARDALIAPNRDRAMPLAAELDPGVIFTEFSGQGLDGVQFARDVRRSMMECRRAPIIMVTAEATASAIKSARDAGVHEFLRKPFTSADIFRRIEAVALKPRDWIEGVAYVGPDRRRFNTGEYDGARKRRSDPPQSAAEKTLSARDQAMRILAAALNQFDSDPVQAVRAARQQAATLKVLAVREGDAQLAVASAELERTLAMSGIGRAALVTPIQAILALGGPLGEPQDLARAG